MALTTRYVTNSGAGAANGTSLADAMSFATFIDYMTAGGSFTAAAGDVFLLCGVSQSRTTTTDSWANGGSATSPVVIRGCDSSGNPAYAGRTNGNGALITTNFASLTYTTGRLILTAWVILEGITVTTSTSNAAVAVGTDGVILRCSVTNSSTNAAAVGIGAASVSRSVVFDNDVFLTGASGGNTGINTNVGTAVKVRYNRVKVTSATATGISLYTTASAIGNTVYGCGGIGIYIASSAWSGSCENNTTVGCTGDGISVITGLTGLGYIAGNMSTDNTGDGIDMGSTSSPVFAAHNRTRDNASGYANAGDWATATKYGDVTTDTGGASTDYVDAGSNDYRLIAASPATSAGIPAYASIGASQRNQTGGGSGGIMRNPSLS